MTKGLANQPAIDDLIPLAVEPDPGADQPTQPC